MAWYGELLVIKKAVLYALLIMLIRIEVVVLQVIEKAGCNRSDPFYIINGRRELLLAVLDGVLEVLKGEN